MMSIKAGQPFIHFTVACYRADLPVLALGPAGVGKSTLIQQAAAELGIHCIVCDLSLLEAPDLIGLPHQEGGRTHYSPPAFLPTSGKGFLFFEELNRAAAHVRAPCLQLLTARRLNDYSLPRGWLPVAAINPPEDGYDVLDLDLALLSRFVKVEVKADRQEWLAWATANGVHPDVIAYAEAERSIFEHPESNPRAWTYVSDFVHSNPQIAQETLLAGVSGIVGQERAGSFLSFVKSRLRPLKAEEVLTDYAALRARFQSWVADGKLDLVTGSVWAVQTHLQAKHHFQAVKDDAQSWRNLSLFLADLPGDLKQNATAFFKEHDYTLPKLRRTKP